MATALEFFTLPARTCALRQLLHRDHAEFQTRIGKALLQASLGDRDLARCRHFFRILIFIRTDVLLFQRRDRTRSLDAAVGQKDRPVAQIIVGFQLALEHLPAAGNDIQGARFDPQNVSYVERILA